MRVTNTATEDAVSAPIFWVDTMRFGKSSAFAYKIPGEFQGKTKKDDLIWAVDIGIEPYLCRVREVKPGGRSAVFERIPNGTRFTGTEQDIRAALDY